MQTMKIMTLCRNKKLTQTLVCIFICSVATLRLTKITKKEHFMLHIKQNLNDELMLKTIIASFNAV